MRFINHSIPHKDKGIEYLLDYDGPLRFRCTSTEIYVYVVSMTPSTFCYISFDYRDRAIFKELFSKFRRQTDEKRRREMFKEILEILLVQMVVDKL